MASTYSTNLRVELMGAGDKSGTWGATTNTQLGTVLEEAISGVAAVTHDDTANYTLSTANGTTDEARQMVLEIGGALTAGRNVVCPTSDKLYFVNNKTTGGFAVTLKTTAGTGIAVPAGDTMILYCDGTNVVDAINNLSTGATVAGVAISTAPSTETLTNKTVNLTSNTLTGTTAQFNTALSDGSFATLAGTETLTNKTLTAPVISTITNTGTVTLPTATDTLVGRATTDTLTNKTLTAAVLGGTTDVSGGQLKFPATQSASADVNTLDDYEEGTWTPTDGSGATLSLTTANCAYTKIGRMVTVTFNITYPSTADGTNAQINGLPFTVGTPGGGMISTHNVATPVHLFSAAAGSSFDFRNDSNGVYTNANLSTKLIYGALTYFV